ncbi:hypothetical protein DFQ26_007175 [Actinomortierella ambigua]|nr:hypothetical protein DFQ26_007175 [Actinomortierella ambigua]
MTSLWLLYRTEAVGLTDQRRTDSIATRDSAGHDSVAMDDSAPRSQSSDQDLQTQLAKVQQKFNAAVDKYRKYRNRIHDLEAEAEQARFDLQRSQSAHSQVSQLLNRQKRDSEAIVLEYRDLDMKYKGLDKKYTELEMKYRDLDMKYMDLVRALQVTGHDRSTINKQLGVASSMIEHLIIRARGKSSANLNRDAAIDSIRQSGMLENLPVRECDLESFHLNLFMECSTMHILTHHLLSRSLQLFFDGSAQFWSIYWWMVERGSKAPERWRQELCITIAQDSQEMERRREKAVSETAPHITDLLSRVYGNVDASMSTTIKELCSMIFDLAFAMLGMESFVHPFYVPNGTPFDEDLMTMAMRSDPNGSVFITVFPGFQDTNGVPYYKPKVWCAAVARPDLTNDRAVCNVT